MEETKTEEEKDKTTGIVYISDNDNMFFAPEGISEEERKRLSLEADRNALRERLSAIESELEDMSKPQSQADEIERGEPYKTDNQKISGIHFSSRKFGNFRNILIFDTETTGVNPYKDELLEFSAVDVNGTPLLNSYIYPEKHTEWPEAQAVNNISPETVADAYPVFQKILKNVHYHDK